MQHLIDWFRSWRSVSSASRQVAALQRECSSVEWKMKKSNALLKDTSREINSMIEVFNNTVDSMRDAHLQYEETIDKLRSTMEVQVMEIKNLEASHTKFLERSRAETAIEVYRQTAVKSQDIN